VPILVLHTHTVYTIYESWSGKVVGVYK